MAWSERRPLLAALAASFGVLACHRECSSRLPYSEPGAESAATRIREQQKALARSHDDVLVYIGIISWQYIEIQLEGFSSGLSPADLPPHRYM